MFAQSLTLLIGLEEPAKRNEYQKLTFAIFLSFFLVYKKKSNRLKTIYNQLKSSTNWSF